MRVIFIGTVKFSLEALLKLIDLNVDLVGVCTKDSSAFNNDYADLKPVCISNSIPFLFVQDINSSKNVKWIKDLRPDVIFCFGWSSLLKKEVLNIAPMGVVGFHPTKLPKNRGRHPIIWALALGLKDSAATFFFMDEGADTGDILAQKDFEISYQDNAQTIYDKVTDIALFQIENFIPNLQQEKYSRVKQDKLLSNCWRKRYEIDGLIDFRMNSEAIYNLTRALTKPYVGAYIKYRGKKISIWKVREIDIVKENIEPGSVLSVVDKTFIVKSYDGAVEVIEHNFKMLPKVGEYL
jgi:methionyl-tRNA formyltransferase